MSIKGQIKYVNAKPFGNKTLYSLKLEGDQTLYRAGDKPFPAGIVVGASVEFEVKVDEAKGTTSIVEGSIKAVAAKAPSEPAPVSVAGKNAAGSVDWAAKDAGIQYQSARKDALQFVTLLLERDIVKIPAKQADKLQAVEAMLDLYTSSFYEDISTKGAVARVLAASEGTAEPAAEAVADDDE